MQKRSFRKPRASTPATFGRQVRTYVLHPYELVRDHRSGVETTDVRGVLDGAIDIFLLQGAPY